MNLQQRNKDIEFVNVLKRQFTLICNDCFGNGEDFRIELDR